MQDASQAVVEIKKCAARLQELLADAHPYASQLDEADKVCTNLLRQTSRITAWSDEQRSKLK